MKWGSPPLRIVLMTKQFDFTHCKVLVRNSRRPVCSLHIIAFWHFYPLWSHISFVCTDLLCCWFISLFSKQSRTHSKEQLRTNVGWLVKALFGPNGNIHFLNPTTSSCFCCERNLGGFFLACWDWTIQRFFPLLQLMLPPEYCPQPLLIHCVLLVPISLYISWGCKALIWWLTPTLNCCGTALLHFKVKDTCVELKW